MDAAIYIGGEETQKTIEATAESIIKIFESARTHGMDQEVIKIALGILPKAFNVSVQNCTFSGINENKAE